LVCIEKRAVLPYDDEAAREKLKNLLREGAISGELG